MPTEFDIAISCKKGACHPMRHNGILHNYRGDGGLMAPFRKWVQLHGSKDVFENIGDSITLAVLSATSVTKSRY
jgi:hypothetical protein